MKKDVTKAHMLAMLKKNIAGIHILPILVVRSGDFFAAKEEVASRVMEFANDRALIVRSSSAAEDTSEFSNAGKFESRLNVKPELWEIIRAIEDVYESYGVDGDEEVLIQPMLRDVKKSGVAFTRDMDTGAGYYTVNFEEGDDTAAVTGGQTNCVRTFVQYKGTPYKIHDADMESVIAECQKIEAYLNHDALDIEFAVTNGGEVFILQVRPIARGRKEWEGDIDLSPALNRIYKKVKKLATPHPFLLGHTTCFGVMPDWNPAEILGVRPKKLAISLYKELITDNVWAHQRKNYGYRDLTMHPLMISFCGIPYIDTRITFNSFIPETLNSRIADKLVNYYLGMLSRYPKYHDKIEFEIVYSCYYLGLPKKLRKLLGHGFNENEITRIEFSLLNLTNNIINPKSGLYMRDIEKIQILEENYDRILNSDISLIDRIYWLIEECKAYGTLPFAGVARAAFIAVQFLRSFVDTGIITKSENDAYMNSLDTVNKKMKADLGRYHEGRISKEEFMKIYGHVRPGTYDIVSKRYDEAFDEYFPFGSHPDAAPYADDFKFSEAQKRTIQQELDENGLLLSVDDLLAFVKRAIEGREHLKFVFTKSVSKILQLVEELGKRTGIAREDMAHVDISVVKQLYVDLHTDNISEVFLENIRNNKRQYEKAARIKLPSIIVRPEDVYAFYLLDEEPNFITQKSADAPAAALPGDARDIENKIVFIQSADPGYDFIFSKNIAGLITQFGGANSHMAIRCAELGIPAVIGVGESRFHEWGRWKMIGINCLLKRVVRIE